MSGNIGLIILRFLHLVRHSWKLQIDPAILVGCLQAYSDMPEVVLMNFFLISPLDLNINDNCLEST